MKWSGGISFKYRIFGSSLLVALLPLLLCSTLMLRMFTATLERQHIDSGEKLASQQSAQLAQALADNSVALQALAANTLVQQALVDHASDNLVKDVYLAIYRAIEGVHNGAVFALYDAGGQLQFSTQNAPLTAKLPIHWGLLRKAGQAGLDTVYISSSQTGAFDMDGICLQAARSIYTPGGARVGYAVCSMSGQQIAQVVSGLSSEGTSLFLFNAQGRLIYSSRPDNANAEAEGLRAVILQGGQSDGDTNSRFYFRTDISSGNMVILRQSAAISTDAVMLMRSISMISAAVCLLMCMLLSLQLSRSLFSPISRMMDAMQRVRAGDLSVRIPPERHDELGQLAGSFNAMAERLETYMDEQVQRQRDLNSAQIRQMQAQLNPHFLYNTLDTMKWLAKIHKLPEVASLASNLGSILRSSINNEQLITLHCELELAQQYIAIQKIRFSDKFQYVIKVPAALEECIVPKLVLQPLVENAIIHGLDGREAGSLCICVKQENDLLVITVTDNGCGMAPEIVERINGPGLKLLDGHLGLYNVGRILQLYYGPDFGLHAASQAGIGTTVTMRIPIRREEADAQTGSCGG